MPKFTVTVQYRSARTITVKAKNESDAVGKAAKHLEDQGYDVIACRVDPSAETV